VVAALNLYSILNQEGVPVAQALFAPQVSAILALSLFFFLTTIADNAFLRGLQIVTFILGGALTAIGSRPGNITSALIAIYGILLVNEYADQKARLLPSIIIGIGYMLTFVITTQTDTRQPVIYLVSATVFTGTIVLLYALISFRQSIIRKEYTDRLEQKVQERTERLRETVHQRDVIIRELHHRVGNSLQLLASYVNLRGAERSGSEAESMADVELRIQAIASVHATLFGLNELISLPLRDYCLDRIADAAVTFSDRASVTSDIDVDLHAHIDFALSLGIILSELITNAAKHASRPSESAAVHVKAWTDAEYFLLSIADSGPGFPTDFQLQTGSIVVDELVQQQRGTITITNEDGGLVRLSFPLAEVSKESATKSIETVGNQDVTSS
jgi:two-component sensor histidine kinase